MSSVSRLACVDRLKNQVALVTGASSGIGRGIALALADEGAQIVVNYIGDRQAAEEVAREIQSKGTDALVLEADVSREDHVESMFARTVREFGTVDILVNNAGIQRDAAVHEMTLQEWQQVVDVNLTGAFLCSREAVREFRRRGLVPERSIAVGKIIFISSVHQVIPWSGHCNYAASKGGLMQLMKSLAQEVARDRIRVNAIAPGAVRTDINRESWEDPAALEALLKLIPSNRIGEPRDIGSAAVWLASDESDYVHGATIFVDGGMTLYPGFASGG
ncbi:MAG: SDR family oxidoreductase [Desulfomonilia bacterium]|jgi:glucose 1-dehydrogenase|nr:SDR family oxidoreductase [Pseudomonadota bacterium]HON38865.1 SDR family oxidoreductase [Deltaproteobacteria bacterium]HRS56824.1 SDR family oxidoreductase [Desulfomonilia bacterium]HPD21989.1 SDR family oxidoreductase [Deltaproteobacteria bacterium]HPW69832.1 SDR family oxidoreductase [Deltaproteobacteria bacterium]